MTPIKFEEIKVGDRFIPSWGIGWHQVTAVGEGFIVLQYHWSAISKQENKLYSKTEFIEYFPQYFSVKEGGSIPEPEKPKQYRIKYAGTTDPDISSSWTAVPIYDNAVITLEEIK